MTKKTSRRHGFTLIEILLVVTIIAILAGVWIGAVGGKQEQAKIAITQGILGKVITELGYYRMLFNEFPTEEQGGLKALVEKPQFEDENLAKQWRAPFLMKKQLKDAWGHDLMYEVVDEQTGDITRQVVHVWSVGPNGEDENGTGDDIKSWEDEGGV